jgi:hypothetical protein
MRHLAFHAALAVLLGTVAACARSTKVGTIDETGAEVPIERAAAEPVTLFFVNNSTYGADVYVSASPGRDEIRLATVSAGQTQRLTVPRSAIRLGAMSVSVRLHPSTRRLQTGQVTVNSGDALTVSLPIGANILTVLPGRP